MNAFCYKFISGYRSAKFIKIGEDVPELLTKVCCHVFNAPQCTRNLHRTHPTSILELTLRNVVVLAESTDSLA